MARRAATKAVSNLHDGLQQYVVEPLLLVYHRVNDAIWAPEASPALRERRTKIVMISGVGVFALALMILFLFVLPATQMGGIPSEAQGPAPGATPPPSPGMPPGAAPGGAPGPAPGEAPDKTGGGPPGAGVEGHPAAGGPLDPETGLGDILSLGLFWAKSSSFCTEFPFRDHSHRTPPDRHCFR